MRCRRTFGVLGAGPHLYFSHSLVEALLLRIHRIAQMLVVQLMLKIKIVLVELGDKLREVVWGDCVLLGFLLVCEGGSILLLLLGGLVLLCSELSRDHLVVLVVLKELLGGGRSLSLRLRLGRKEVVMVEGRLGLLRSWDSCEDYRLYHSKLMIPQERHLHPSGVILNLLSCGGLSLYLPKQVLQTVCPMKLTVITFNDDRPYVVSLSLHY